MIGRRILALFLFTPVAISVVMAAGCAGGSNGLASVSGTTVGATVTVTESPPGAAAATLSTVTAQAATEGVRSAKALLIQALGLDAKAISQAVGSPASPQADVVLSWTGGSAEVDSSSGRIYSVAVMRPAGDQEGQSMTDEGLSYQALQMVGKLGWTKGMLEGLGFKLEQPGTFTGDGTTYSLTWSQHDPKGKPTDGRVAVQLDTSTAALLGFSVSLGAKSPDLAGSISEVQAMGIAQTEIYLMTDKPKLTLAGDGSLLLPNKTVSGTLGLVSDRKITKGKQVLMWVITIMGKVDSQTVGGTVYIDAKTGVVASYQPVKNE